ncbi:hypothetical protein H8D36_03425 [archaeon]|nr:hypothetical protein [archaeon]MBL7056836.1 hypothetical protein [Candidatus Woesearchaeota archaeon]
MDLDGIMITTCVATLVALPQLGAYTMVRMNMNSPYWKKKVLENNSFSDFKDQYTREESVRGDSRVVNFISQVISNYGRKKALTEAYVMQRAQRPALALVQPDAQQVQ